MEPGPNAPTAWDAERVSLGRSFLRDMERLWGELLRMAAIVESALNTAVKALCDARPDLALEAQGNEPLVNRLDVQIELDCLKVLALHQPVASDLRRVATILKVERDLERLADLTDHISNRARKLAKDTPPLPIPGPLYDMAQSALDMVHRSLDALVRADAELARSVILADRRVDRQRRLVIRDLKDSIRRDPERLDSWLRLINVARNVERVADHATNIAEAVIYLTEATIVRHSERRAPKPRRSPEP